MSRSASARTDSLVGGILVQRCGGLADALTPSQVAFISKKNGNDREGKPPVPQRGSRKTTLATGERRYLSSLSIQRIVLAALEQICMSKSSVGNCAPMLKIVLRRPAVVLGNCWGAK